MRQPKFDALVKSIVSIKQDGCVVPPNLFIFEKDKTMPIVHACVGDDSRERAKSCYVTGKLCAVKNVDVDFVVLATESWLVRAKKEDESILDIKPSQHPDRIDTLVFIGLSSDKEAVAKLFTIENGRCKLMEDASHDFKKQSSTEGFTGLLDDFFQGYES